MVAGGLSGVTGPFFNGPYIHGTNSYFGGGIIWKGFKGYHYSLKRSQMKIRLRDF